MGQWTSKQLYGGTLLGAFAPPISNEAIPDLPSGPRYRVTVPIGSVGGDMVSVNHDGVQRSIRVPPGMKGGDKFEYQAPPAISSIFASTLNRIPGMEVIQSKPVIYSSAASCCFQTAEWKDLSEGVGEKVGELMQEVQSHLLEEAARISCNAVLGMNFRVTIDSTTNYLRMHGRTMGRDEEKVVVVTAYGTPCSLVAATNLPVTDATAVIIPLFNDHL